MSSIPSAAAPGAALDRPRAIHVEQVRRFSVQAAWSHLVGAPLGAAVVAVIMERYVSAPRVLTWLGLVLAALVVHALTLRDHDRRYRSGEAPGWTLWRAFDIALQGFAWGSLALLAFPGSDAPEAQVLVLVFMCAASTSGSLSCAPLRAAYYPYVIAMWTPVVVAFALDGSELNQLLAIASVIYLVILAGYYTLANRNVVDMIRFRHDAAALAERVALEQERTLSVNAELRRAHAEVQRLALLDDVTGVANRRHLLAVLEHELATAARTGLWPSLALIDIDRFKAVNDTYGHIAGDDALRHVATTIAGTARAADAVARFGGEEFAVLMPATALAGAVDGAERIRAAVAASAVPGLDDLHLTVSIGVASATSGTDAAQLIGAADAALYAAKHGGRDRVSAASALAPDAS